MKRTFVALAVVVAVVAGPAGAQSMQQGLDMVETAAASAFDNLGIDDIDFMELSLRQLQGVERVLASSDFDDARKAREIRAVVERMREQH